MAKQFKYDVFLKLTDAGNIYVGFTPEHKKIERSNKGSWTTQYQFFKTVKNEILTTNNTKTWESYGVSTTELVPLCNYIREIIKIGFLNKSTIFNVINSTYKELLFKIFHSKSPLYEKQQSAVSILGICSAKLTEVDETEEFFEHQENIKSKMPDLRPDYLKFNEPTVEEKSIAKSVENKIENIVENKVENKPTIKTEKIVTKLDKILLLI